MISSPATSSIAYVQRNSELECSVYQKYILAEETKRSANEDGGSRDVFGFRPLEEKGR